MGSKHLVQLHLPHIIYHHHHHHHNNNNGRKQQQQQQQEEEEKRDVPKGCLAVKVGQGSEEDQQRFVVPVIYFNHPLFMQLLKEAEEEYGFQHKGPITIPCNIHHFQTVLRRIIDNEHRRRHHHHHHHQLVGCFRA